MGYCIAHFHYRKEKTSMPTSDCPSSGADAGNFSMMHHNGRAAGGGNAAILKPYIACVCDNHPRLHFYPRRKELIGENPAMTIIPISCAIKTWSRALWLKFRYSPFHKFVKKRDGEGHITVCGTVDHPLFYQAATHRPTAGNLIHEVFQQCRWCAWPRNRVQPWLGDTFSLRA